MQEDQVKQKPKKSFDFKRSAVGIFAGVFIFALGMNVGSGQIQFGLNRSLISNSENADLPDKLDYTSIDQLYDSLKRTYDGKLDVNELLDGMKAGLAKATGDEYTEYLNVADAKEFDEALNGTFSGIGAELGKENDLLVIVSPIAGFPAEKAGLRPRDVITKIDDVPAYDLSVTEAVSKIRGPVGTKVTLTIVREQSKELTFEITRATITIPSVTHEVIDGNIGYLNVSRFSDDTIELAETAVEEFRAAGIEGIILDLRGNPGGLLDSAVDLSSFWLDKGTTVLQEKRGGEVVKTFTAKGRPALKDVPTVVLINAGSASASEITAGALKDNGVATLIGEKSFGKGSVQSLENLIAGGVLKVTIARWHTPSGKNIDKEGIEPDQVVERTDEDFTAGRDPQLDAAVNFLKK